MPCDFPYFHADILTFNLYSGTIYRLWLATLYYAVYLHAKAGCSPFNALLTIDSRTHTLRIALARGIILSALEELIASHQNTILYDGECPVCSNYVDFLQFKEEVGEVVLMDCRAHPDIVSEARARGYDLNDGMILVLNGQLFYGDKAVQKIAQSSNRQGFFNRLQSTVFQYDAAAKAFYPVLVIGRKALLKILGRSKI